MDSRFKDSKGREWNVVVDGYVLGRARTHGKLDLSSVINSAMNGGSIDPAVLLELAFYGCEHHSRIQAGKITKEDFLRSLKGKAMIPALEATASAVAECFGVEIPEEDPGPDPSESVPDPAPDTGGTKTGSESPGSPA